MSLDATAEFEAIPAEPAELRWHTVTSVGAKTDIGRIRENNEDKHEFYIPEDQDTLARRGQIFVVCDGMGGHEAGQHASELGVKTFIDVYLTHPADEPEEAALAAVLSANRFVFLASKSMPNRRGMGSTLSSLLLVQNTAVIAHAGDSRVYRLRDGELKQLTRDHTVLAEAEASGMSMEQLGGVSPHAITRCIGYAESLVPDVTTEDLQEGDAFLICSDGITGHLPDEQIVEMLALSPSQAAWKMVNAALADGGQDNATALVVRVDELRESQQEAQS